MILPADSSAWPSEGDDNMIDKKSLLYFVGGFLAGCVSGYLIARDRMINKKSDISKEDNIGIGYRRQEPDSKVERRYNASVRPVEASRRRFTPEMGESLEQARKSGTVDSRGVDEDPREALNGILAESEAPIEPAHAEEIENDIEWADSMTKRAVENRGRRPRIISAETMGDLDATWDVQTLYYYAYNDVLATEDGEVIDDVGLTVGDSLLKYGFAGDARQREIIVQNFDFSTVYEVEKVFGEYDAGL